MKDLPFELTKNEALITEMERSKAPYFLIWGLVGSCTILSFIVFIQLLSAGEGSLLSFMVDFRPEEGVVVAPLFAVISIISLLAGLLAAHIYSLNRMFITNEHIVRVTQYGLTATDRKVISHLNIEDVKVRQNILGKLLNYGMVTLSTEGQNATYKINFIKNAFDYERLLTDTRDEYQQSVIDDGGRAIPLAEKR
jgi:membrane protein YdbS with pleckstrin-like domain